MKKYLTIKQAKKLGEGDVDLRGWCYRERGSKKLRFIVLRDAEDIIQCVIEKDTVSEDEWKTAEDIRLESSFTVSGHIKPDERAPGGFELQVKEIKPVTLCSDYPITKDQSTEFLLDVRHLSIRSRRLGAVMRIKSTILQAFREFYYSEGFFEAPMPILQPSQCEGGSTLFEVKYYKDKTYLSQSWQLYAEAVSHSIERIFAISPAFRAEKSKTSRHLSEFWMAEMEATWYELPELLESMEKCVYSIVQRVLEKHRADLEVLERDISKLEKVKLPFPKITYTEALKILKEKGGMDVVWGKDLRTIEEDKLMEFFDSPVLVTHYPREIMAFYKPADKDDPKTALCVDMLAPEGYGEICGGSQRDMDVEGMKAQLIRDGEDVSNYEWYFDVRKYGGVPHSGFGMGVERVVSWICGIDNIKDAIAFPRTMLRFKP